MTGVRTVDNDEWKQREWEAANRAREIAVNSNRLSEVDSDYVVVRGLLPARDLDSGDENGWVDTTGNNPDHEWRQDWSSGGANAGAYNEAYAVDSNSLADDKAIVIYGISINSTAVDVRQVRFRGGDAGSSGVLQEANLEILENDDESRGVLPTDVEFEVPHHGQIEMWLDAANDGQRVLLHGWVAESPGENVTNPTYPDFC